MLIYASLLALAALQSVSASPMADMEAVAKSSSTTKIKTSSTTWAPVQTVSATIAARSDVASLPALPTSLASDVVSFLDKYQGDSAEAANYTAASALTGFPAVGLCTVDYPCLAVDNVTMADFGSEYKMTLGKMDDVLNKIKKHAEIKFDPKTKSTSVGNGTTFSSHHYTVDVMAATGSYQSAVVAGAVFDLFKAQGIEATSNAVRGATFGDVKTSMESVILCVYPKKADKTAITNFCLGKELDGSALGASV